MGKKRRIKMDKTAIHKDLKHDNNMYIKKAFKIIRPLHSRVQSMVGDITRFGAWKEGVEFPLHNFSWHFPAT